MKKMEKLMPLEPLIDQILNEIRLEILDIIGYV
jgi:hypothetical protein